MTNNPYYRNGDEFDSSSFPQGPPQGFSNDYFEPPPFGPPPGAGLPPMAPPPGFSPPIPAWQVGPGGIRNCLFSNTYVWLRNGRSFWFFPTFVGRQVIVGYRWRRRRGWTYHFLNPNEILSYQCF